jgi:hypothetical protein
MKSTSRTNSLLLVSHQRALACALISSLFLVVQAATSLGQICQHTYDFNLEAVPSQFGFGTTPPNATTMANAISTRMGGIPVSVVTSPLADENTAFPPVLGDTGQPPFYNYGPGPGQVVPGGAIYNINLNRTILIGVLQGQIRFVGTDLEPDGNQYDRYLFRAYTSTSFYDVLVKIHAFTYQPDNGGVCGITAGRWDFYQISGPRPIQGPTLTSAVSRKVHGSAGTFDLNLPLSGTRGVECRSGGANGNHSIVFTFSDPITAVDSAVVTPCGQVSSRTLGPNANQYTVNLTNVCNAQYITVTLLGVHSTFGGITATASATMGVLVGDTTANGAVNSSDIAQTQSASGQPLSANNFREDVTVNGAINSSDISAVQAASGTALPTSP